MLALSSGDRRISLPSLQLAVLLILINGSGDAWSYQYKVGDLDAWGPPPSSNPRVYAGWSLNHNFSIGDSLLFLYPPSQDSVIQVTERAFNSCSVADPILTMGDGNSVFNLTSPGYFYFTSGIPGRCQKLQKLAVAVPSANGSFFPPADAQGAASALPATSPSYPTVFGPSAAQESGSPRRSPPPASAAAFGAAIGGALLCLFRGKDLEIMIDWFG